MMRSVETQSLFVTYDSCKSMLMGRILDQYKTDSHPDIVDVHRKIRT